MFISREGYKLLQYLRDKFIENDFVWPTRFFTQNTYDILLYEKLAEWYEYSPNLWETKGKTGQYVITFKGLWVLFIYEKIYYHITPYQVSRIKSVLGIRHFPNVDNNYDDEQDLFIRGFMTWCSIEGIPYRKVTFKGVWVLFLHENGSKSSLSS